MRGEKGSKRRGDACPHSVHDNSPTTLSKRFSGTIAASCTPMCLLEGTEATILLYNIPVQKMPGFKAVRLTVKKATKRASNRMERRQVDQFCTRQAKESSEEIKTMTKQQ